MIEIVLAADAPNAIVAVVPVEPFRAVNSSTRTSAAAIVALTAGDVAVTVTAAGVAEAIVTDELYLIPMPSMISVACTTAADVEPVVRPENVSPTAPAAYIVPADHADDPSAAPRTVVAVVGATVIVPAAAVATTRDAEMFVVNDVGSNKPPLNVVTTVPAAAIAVPLLTTR